MPVELTRQELGRLLAEQLATSPTPKELADWAHVLYLDRSKADGVVQPLMTLIAMDEGPEFVLGPQELRQLATDLMARFTYYEVVVARSSDDTVAAEVVGERGPILGLPDPDDASGEQRYTVMLDGRAICLREQDLASTGEGLDREDVYPGPSIRVSKDGKPLPPVDG